MSHQNKLLATWLILITSILAGAKEQPTQSIDWPDEGSPALRFTVGKIQKIGSYSGQGTYSIDTTVQNLTKRPISRATFNFYMYDKNKVRIGDGFFDFNNLGPGETLKIRVNATSTGTPASLSVAAGNLPPELQANAPPKTTNITIYSVPAGAKLKVDGKEYGATPLAVTLNVGSHTLEFAKEGYTNGTFPLVISPDQLSGATVSYELGTSAHDTVELRDGTVLTGDVESVDATSVNIHLGGSVQKFDRNQVKRILLIPREAVHATN